MGKSTTAKASDVIPLHRLRHLDHAIFGHLVIARQSSTDKLTYLYDDVNASINATPASAFKGRRNRIVRSVSFDFETIENKAREKRERKKRKSAGDAVRKSEPAEEDKLDALFARNVDDEDVFDENGGEQGQPTIGQDEGDRKSEKKKVFERQNSAPCCLTSPESPVKVKMTSRSAIKSRTSVTKFEEIDEEFNSGDSTTYVMHKKPAQRAFSAPSSDRSQNEGDAISPTESGDPQGVVPSPVTSPTPSRESLSSREGSEGTVLSLVDDLLYEIYEKEGCASPSCRRYSNSSVAESDYWSTTSYMPHGNRLDDQTRPGHHFMQEARLRAKGAEELHAVHDALVLHVQHAGARLVRNLRRREALLRSRDKKYDVVTAHLQALSEKRMEDARLRFSAMPHPGDSGFAQWHDAMKMVARLPGGIPPDFRRRLWLTLAEKHLEKRRVEWRLAERSCFNEWTNPDDEDLGVQIVKDLHRTGCSLFCGAAAEQNQALLKRVLLGFARWNKTVGYCQGFNMLAALILQVVDRSDSDALKVMIYLIEGVLPESYFANNLRGLSVDMAVFRDLLGLRLPALSRHLEQLQQDAGDTTTGTSYEPPLTNVFTMQWFLTLFSNCLPQSTVLRVWDLVFLEGNGVLLRTALAIWESLQERIMAVDSADEFYSIMGVLTREMLEFGLMDSNNLVKAVVRLPLPELCELRDRHLYDISPWSSRPSMVARRLRLFHADDTDEDTDDDEAKLAVAATYGLFRQQRRRESTSTSLSSLAYSPERDRLAGLDINLDISALKEQYSKIRQRQRQAHIILSAACARQPLNVAPAGQVAMNHLLLGKSALISMRGRRGAPPGSVPPPVVRGRGRRDKELRPQPATKHGHLVTSKTRVTCPQPSSGETLHWKDASSRKPPAAAVSPSPSDAVEDVVDASDSSSTSTELCDEPDRLSDFDSEPTSLVIDDDDLVGREDAVKECVEVKEEIEKKVRELFRDFSKESDEGDEAKADTLVDLNDGGDGDEEGKKSDGLASAESSGDAQKSVENALEAGETSFYTLMDFREDSTLVEKDVDALEPVEPLAEQKSQIGMAPLEVMFDSKVDSAVETELLESAKSSEDLEVSQQLQQLSDGTTKKLASVDSLLGLQDENLTKYLDATSPPDISSSSRNILEMFGDAPVDDDESFSTFLDFEDGNILGGDVLDSPDVPKTSNSSEDQFSAFVNGERNNVEDVDARLSDLPDNTSIEENFLDFSKEEILPKDLSTLRYLEFDQLTEDNIADPTADLSEVPMPTAVGPESLVVKSPDEQDTFASKSSYQFGDDLTDEQVLAALSICVMDLRGVPPDPPPCEIGDDFSDDQVPSTLSICEMDSRGVPPQPPPCADDTFACLDSSAWQDASVAANLPEVSPATATGSDSLVVKSSVEEKIIQQDAFFSKSTLEIADDHSDDQVPSALSICVMDLRFVPPQPPPCADDTLNFLDSSAWQDSVGLADDVDKSADESFEEFVSGRSKSPVRSDSIDQKDILKDLVSKLSLDLGGGGDVDVVRRSDIEVVRAKQMEPMTPFYKPKDAKELFTIVDTPDDDATPPPRVSAKAQMRDVVSPEVKQVYRKFVFPVVVPSPDEKTTSSPPGSGDKANGSPNNGVGGNGDCFSKYFSKTSDDRLNELDCESSVSVVDASDTDVANESSHEEFDSHHAAPLQVLPLDVLPVGASFNLGRRKSERALQLISENSEILSQLTRERRLANSATVAEGVSSARRHNAPKKCPSFDVGTERVTKIAGFKFHSYSVDGMTSPSVSSDEERSMTATEGADATKMSPGRGSFDPFPVKRRPKQLGLYSPT